MKMVLVLWNDSSIEHGWRVDDCTNDKVAYCRTVGILKAEGKEKITVALGDSDCGSVMETITIPKSCIKLIRRLRVR